MAKSIQLSSSKIQTFLSCRRKYWFSYVENLKPITREAPLSFGSSLHSALELMFKNGNGKATCKEELYKAIVDSYTPDELLASGCEPDVALLAALAFDKSVGWRSSWEFLNVEPSFEVSTGHGKKLVGRYDGIIRVNGSLYVLEHKTVSGAVTERRLNHLLWDMQAGLYIMSAWEQDIPVVGVMYNFIPKPTIDMQLATPPDKRKYTKEGKLYANQRELDETRDEYLARVEQWYAEHSGGDYFRQHIVTRNRQQVDGLLRNVNQIAKDIRTCEKTNSFYMNPSACQMLSCPFVSVCLEDSPEAREANFNKKETAERRQEVSI